MRFLLNVSIALIVCACSEDHVRSELEEAQAGLRSTVEARRSIGSGKVVELCCRYPPDQPGPDAPRACALLPQLVESPDEAVMRAALYGWQPACRAAVPDSAVIGALERATTATYHILIIEYLSERELTAEILRALVRELAYEDKACIRHCIDVGSHVAVALAKYGEAELAPVLEVLRTSRVPVARRGAARTLALALLTAPLELPGLWDALDDADLASDPELEERVALAMGTLREYQDRRGSPERAIKQFLRSRPPIVAIQFLARRRWFCGVALATETLERFAADQDPVIAGAAKRGIALRAERCGT